MFLNAIIQFLIVAFAIFWLVKAISRFQRKEAAVLEPTRSELLLAEIRHSLAARPLGASVADRP